MKTIKRNMAVLYIDEPTILNDYKPKPMEINWSACGSVPVDIAEEFAKGILELVAIAKGLESDKAGNGEV
jgi:hypothetical protein